MKIRAGVLTILLLLPFLLKADMWGQPLCSFYLPFYVVTVVPVVLWIANAVVFIMMWRARQVNRALFWLVNLLSIILACISLFPVFVDMSDHYNDDLEDFGPTLFLCVLVPAYFSVASIRMLLKGKQLNAGKEGR